MNLASHFSNFTDFRHLQIPNAWTKYYEILPAHTKTPHNTPHKIARLYFEFKYHFSTLQNKFRLLLNKGVHSQLPWYDHPIFVWDKSHWGLVTSCIVINLGIGWVNGLLPDVPSHYLNHCLRTVTTWLHCHWKYHWEWNVFLVVSASKLSLLLHTFMEYTCQADIFSILGCCKYKVQGNYSFKCTGPFETYNLYALWFQCQRPLLITSIDFNSSMDKWSYTQYSVGWHYVSIPKLQWLCRWSLGMDK